MATLGPVNIYLTIILFLSHKPIFMFFENISFAQEALNVYATHVSAQNI